MPIAILPVIRITNGHNIRVYGAKLGWRTGKIHDLNQPFYMMAIRLFPEAGSMFNHKDWYEYQFQRLPFYDAEEIKEAKELLIALAI